MTTYRMHEGELAVPAGWSSDTLNLLRVAHPEGPVEVTVARVPVGESDLATAMELHTAQLRRGLPRFELVHSRERRADNKPVVDFAVRYTSDEGPHYQRSAAALVAEHMLLLGAVGEVEHTSAVDEVFERALRTLVWQRPESA